MSCVGDSEKATKLETQPRLAAGFTSDEVRRRAARRKRQGAHRHIYVPEAAKSSGNHDHRSATASGNLRRRGGQGTVDRRAFPFC